MPWATIAGSGWQAMDDSGTNFHYYGPNGKNVADILNGKLLVYDPANFNAQDPNVQSVLQKLKPQMGSAQDVSNAINENAPGNGNGNGSMMEGLTDAALFAATAGAGGALAGAAPGVEAGAGGAFDMGGTAGALGPGASGSALSSLAPGVDGATYTAANGALDGEGTLTTTSVPDGPIDYNNLANQGILDANGNLIPGAGANAAGGFTGASDLLSSLGGASGLLKTLGPIAGPIIAGLIGKSAATTAANTQSAATDRALAQQEQQFTQSRDDLAPYRAAGTAALSRLQDLVGIGPNSPAGTTPGLPKFTSADLASDVPYNTGLQFGLTEGEKAINNRASASGSYDSGATLKGLTRFANDYGSTKAADAYGRFTSEQDRNFGDLSGIAGMGSGATSVGVNAGANNSTALSSLITGQGNAAASAGIAGSNAISSGINTGVNNFNQYQLLSQLTGGGQRSVAGTV